MSHLPNFFLAGAPKAGTTSLYAYLGQHPEIYLSPIKEPCYFADEVRPKHLAPELLRTFERDQRKLHAWLQGPRKSPGPGAIVVEWETYGKLFEGAREQKAIGEASVTYLWSSSAARNIARRLPGSRILILLRDPADRAFSQYLQTLTSGHSRHSFREHIRRSFEHRGSLLSTWSPFLEFGWYAAQIKRYLEFFPRDRIHIVLYEDYRRDPAGVIAQVFDFLQVDPRVRVDTSVEHNQPRVPRFGTAGYVLKRLGIWQRGRRMIPDRMARALRPLALAPRQSLVMDPEDRKYLRAYYRDDTLELQGLLGRDLSAWLR